VKEDASSYDHDRAVCARQKFTSHESIVTLSDVHFHKSNRPIRRCTNAKQYFSSKHYDYGLKIATIHYTNGLCVHVIKHYPESTYDFHIFKQHTEIYEKLLRKKRMKKNFKL
jgi:hypothetical protein